MTLAFLLLLFADAQFWETKPVAEWTDPELSQMFAYSPWGVMAAGPGRGAAAAPPVQVYLATAGPIVQAEQERERRAALKGGRKAKDDPLAEEYRLWLEDNRMSQIVIAARVLNNAAFYDQQEVRRMEDQSVLRVGRRKLKLTGHFPPSAGDPFLRLAFPREVELSDKTIVFELYLPGVPAPFRQVQFNLKDLVLKGKLEL